MTPQAAKNEIGRLNRIIDDLRKDKAALHQDVIGQRNAIALALEKLKTGNTAGSVLTLDGVGGYRKAQREPRKEKRLVILPKSQQVKSKLMDRYMAARKNTLTSG